MPTPIRHFGTQVVAEGVTAVKKEVTALSPARFGRIEEPKNMPRKEVVARGQLSGLESGAWKGLSRN
jgi:hypothetical protein